MDKLKQEEKTQDNFKGIINKLPVGNTYTNLTGKQLDTMLDIIIYGKRRKTK